jgi:hypothetical protein
MKLTLLPALSILAISALLGGCSGDDDEAPDNSAGSGGTGQAGKGGTGGTGTAGTGTGGAAAGKGGTGGSASGSGGTGTAGTGTGGAAAGKGGTGGAAAGTGGAASGSGGAAGGGSDSPSDTTQAGIEAFLSSTDYRDAGWVSDTAAPHPAVEATSPHGRVQLWFNGTLRRGASQTPRPSGSMIVKELYDAGTNVIGHAVMVRSTATTNQWIYYCVASENGRCTMSSMANTPSYSLGTGVCSCHGAGTVITPIPPP